MTPIDREIRDEKLLAYYESELARLGNRRGVPAAIKREMARNGNKWELHTEQGIEQAMDRARARRAAAQK